MQTHSDAPKEPDATQPVIEITWQTDEHECDTCGTAYAEGARVRINGEDVLDLAPGAYCYDGTSYSREQVYRKIIEALGYRVVDADEPDDYGNDEYWND